MPSLEIWRQSARNWHAPLERDRLSFAAADPLVEQLRHFAEVIRGEAAPRVPAREGLRTLEVIAAIRRATETGGRVAVDETQAEELVP